MQRSPCGFFLPKIPDSLPDVAEYILESSKKQIKTIIIIFKTKTYFYLQFEKQDAIMQTCTWRTNKCPSIKHNLATLFRSLCMGLKVAGGKGRERL